MVVMLTISSDYREKLRKQSWWPRGWTWINFYGRRLPRLLSLPLVQRWSSLPLRRWQVHKGESTQCMEIWSVLYLCVCISCVHITDAIGAKFLSNKHYISYLFCKDKNTMKKTWASIYRKKSTRLLDRY